MSKHTIKILPVINRAKGHIFYDEITGLFTRKTATGKIINAGCEDKNGYVKIWIKGKSYLAHRIAWAIYYNDEPPKVIDHQDHNKHNNKISNLIGGSHRDNLCNQKLSINSTTGHNGISFRKDRKKYTAYIHIHGKKHNLGVFDDLNSAILARDKANKEYSFHENHGEMF